MRSADVAVVGAGPAGVAAALTLHRAGRDVVVLDKATFPRDKFCGDGLTAAALRLYEDLGLDPGTVANWQPVHTVKVASASGRVQTFALPDDGLFAVVAPRLDLDAAFLDVARKEGVDVRDGTGVTGASLHPDRVVLETGDNEWVQARYVIAADGMWSPMRKFVGATVPAYRGEWHAFRAYFSDVGPAAASELWVWFDPDVLPGYIWSFPLPGNRANVGFGIQRGAKYQVRDMKRVWPDILTRPHVRGVLGPDATLEGPHRAWPIPARVHDIALAHDRVLFAGDAAAATDPMTGEGIAQALVTGIHAAEAAIHGGPDRPGVVRDRYQKRVADELFADHALARLLSRALSHRKGSRVALRLVGSTDWTARNFARWLFEDYPRAVLATPRRWRRGMLTGAGAYRDSGPKLSRRLEFSNSTGNGNPAANR